MWQALMTEQSIDDAYTMLSTEFDVEPARLRQDLLELLAKLTEKGLQRIRDRIGSGTLTRALDQLNRHNT
jgi:Coenzyme PQQ synthesis protein D (PqqD)